MPVSVVKQQQLVQTPATDQSVLYHTPATTQQNVTTKHHSWGPDHNATNESK